MMLFTTVGLLSCVISIVSADADGSDNRMSFFQALQGDWEVQRTKIYMTDGMQQESEPTYFHYSIAKDNETEDMSLVGRFYQKDQETGDTSEDLELVVDFTDVNSGIFKTQSKFEFTLQPLFKFEFRNYPNGVLLSHGDWQGDVGAFYQFQIPDFTTFTITVYPKKTEGGNSNPSNGKEDIDDEEFISSRAQSRESGDDDFEVILYLGKKFVVPPEKSIVQKYGWVIIGGMIILNIYFQKKQRQPHARPPAPSSKPQRSQAGSKKSK